MQCFFIFIKYNLIKYNFPCLNLVDYFNAKSISSIMMALFFYHLPYQYEFRPNVPDFKTILWKQTYSSIPLLTLETEENRVSNSFK